MNVSELNLKAKALLEAHFDNISLSGELSNITVHSSGHWYFELKDDKASISCIMFRANNSKLNFVPKAGDFLELSGTVSLYAESGRYQFIAKNMQKAGLGDLEAKFLELKERLEKEGLFDEKFKKKISPLPQKVGIISSFTSAALEDMLKLIRQKEYFLAKFYLFNALTQGLNAPASIIKALKKADEMGLDLIIIARGGGSKQDLFCFNDEALAREIFKAKTPIISAIGHEIDYVISDFVADLRAPTPSAAINLAFFSKDELAQKLDNLEDRLVFFMKNILDKAEQSLSFCEKMLKARSPKELLDQKIKQLVLLQKQLNLLITSKINTKKSLVEKFENALSLHNNFFEKSKNLVCIQKNGKMLPLKELKSGEIVDLLSFDSKKEAKIL
ncbi:exodeoxyribonuclease VII, large subunit [Campylobacter avium LMG 24591]|uniref:Exodeoxyribonuclease 7 large subunit n=1 Tax=Campylobacter avium LMG 24591 TaxID=522484 RepID=A0A222MVY8_9BACT|nr:exodeoxyribonuclease VII large subunit [Campylobacter avium]ASQ29856.1 exodeoxyribonuclease VII, large subunit [Campylobacter avium LMG 24591]OYD78955.1 exodeoxyribonuclease VII, large subunit [Campylobacter avium]